MRVVVGVRSRGGPSACSAGGGRAAGGASSENCHAAVPLHGARGRAVFPALTRSRSLRHFVSDRDADLRGGRKGFERRGQQLPAATRRRCHRHSTFGTPPAPGASPPTAAAAARRGQDARAPEPQRRRARHDNGENARRAATRAQPVGARSATPRGPMRRRARAPATRARRSPRWLDPDGQAPGVPGPKADGSRVSKW